MDQTERIVWDTRLLCVVYEGAQWRFLGARLTSALQPDYRDERVRLKPCRSEWPSNDSMECADAGMEDTRLQGLRCDSRRRGISDIP